MNNRMDSLDLLRGISIMLVIFFHTSIYNYANIHKIDFSNPPAIVVVMSFLVLWGGLIIFYSGMVNAKMLCERIEKVKEKKHVKYLLIAGGIYIIIHYILNILLGRWNIDFVNNQPEMTFIASSIRNMQLTFPHISKYFEGSSISTIGLNLIILSPLLHYLLRDEGYEKEKRNYRLLSALGFFIMLFSFVRIYIYDLTNYFLKAGNYLMATLLSFLIANPYPLLPYLAYGLFASIIGVMIYKKRKRLIKKVIFPIGFFFMIYGLIGCMNFPKSISKADYFWYFKTHLELGIFILLIIFFVLNYELGNKVIKNSSFISWFSRISLTIYLLETTVSELLGKLLHHLIPSWNQTINGCLLFGIVNIIIWVFSLNVWRRNHFKYSLEYWWVKLFHKLGKSSSKMDFAELSNG